MGDRCLVAFTDGDEISPVIYLHWNGGDAPDYILETAKLMQGREKDIPYTAARFIGVCHDHIPGNLSLGTWNSPKEWASLKVKKDESHGDAGVLIVKLPEWEIHAFHGYFVSSEKMKISDTNAAIKKAVGRGAEASWK